MSVLEPGPGMGFFTIELARLGAPSGHVIAVDLQPRMLDKLRNRAEKAGLLERIQLRQATAESLGLDDLESNIDFVLAFAMVHEMPSAATFFEQAVRTMKPGATLLLAEPAGHVKHADFEAELAQAAQAGLQLVERPAISRTHTAVFTKPAGS